MNKLIQSYVLRIMQIQGDEGLPEIRIKLCHVQSDHEIYLSSMEEVKRYLEKQIEHLKG